MFNTGRGNLKRGNVRLGERELVWDALTRGGYGTLLRLRCNNISVSR